jgi:HNH endonuclease
VPHPRHQEVRERYAGCCGYCGVSEVDAGGELTVDHFSPVRVGGGDSDDNLVYACVRCNQYKGDFVPDADDQEHGRRVLHPLLDDVSFHVRLDDRSGELKALSETGRFHITLLQLNRPALVRHRLRRRLMALTEERERLLSAENERLRDTVDAQRAYIDRLRRMLGLPPRRSD